MMARDAHLLANILAQLLMQMDADYYTDQFTDDAFPEERALHARIASVEGLAADAFRVVLTDGKVLIVRVTRKRGATPEEAMDNE